MGSAASRISSTAPTASTPNAAQAGVETERPAPAPARRTGPSTRRTASPGSGRAALRPASAATRPTPTALPSVNSVSCRVASAAGQAGAAGQQAEHEDHAAGHPQHRRAAGHRRRGQRQAEHRDGEHDQRGAGRRRPGPVQRDRRDQQGDRQAGQDHRYGLRGLAAETQRGQRRGDGQQHGGQHAGAVHQRRRSGWPAAATGPSQIARSCWNGSNSAATSAGPMETRASSGGQRGHDHRAGGRVDQPAAAQPARAGSPSSGWRRRPSSGPARRSGRVPGTAPRSSSAITPSRAAAAAYRAVGWSVGTEAQAVIGGAADQADGGPRQVLRDAPADQRRARPG